MIKITCDEPTDARWRKWKRQCQDARAKTEASIAKGKRPKFSADVYKGATYDLRAWYFFAPGLPFYGKCAYCEKHLLSSQHGDVEHYRPKDAVRDARNRIVHVVIDGKKVPHPGYYWLAYEWQNLLPSCALCNQLNKRSEGKGMIGKGNRFPVEGDYAFRPGQETSERPLLLLPTVDDPRDHIDVSPTGVLTWRTNKGQTTIELLGLNERGLPNERKKVYDATKQKIQVMYFYLARPPGTVPHDNKAEVKDMKAGIVEYSAAAQRAVTDYLADIDQLWRELGST